MVCRPAVVCGRVRWKESVDGETVKVRLARQVARLANDLSGRDHVVGAEASWVGIWRLPRWVRDAGSANGQPGGVELGELVLGRGWTWP